MTSKKVDEVNNLQLKATLGELFRQLKILWARDEPNFRAVSFVELALLTAAIVGAFVAGSWALLLEWKVALGTMGYVLVNTVGLILSRLKIINTVQGSRILVVAIFIIVFAHIFLIWDRSVASTAWIVVATCASLLFLTLKESIIYYLIGIGIILLRTILVSTSELPLIEIIEWVFVTSIMFWGVATLVAVSVHYYEEARIQFEKIRLSEEEIRATKRARDLFFSEVSHDLLTPLNAICGISNIMVEQGDKATEKALKMRLHSSSKQLLILVRDLLDHTKLESNSLSLMKQPFNIRGFFKDIYNVCDVLAIANNVDLLIELDDALPNYIVGDSQRMMQIVFNLVNNAIKFSPNGEVKITVDAESVSDEFVQMKLCVIDNGIGIEPENQEIIFETYTQANSEIARRFGGTGLGLSITKSLVELIGGEISLKSAVGEGSTFTIVTDFEYVDEIEVEKSSEFTSERVLSVLVVDDSEINRKLARVQLLRRFPNAKIEEAHDGVHAIEQVVAHEGPYDAIIMDIKMPRMNGLDASREILARVDGRANTNIYGLSADNNAEQIASGLEIGLRDYLLKPCDYDLLGSLIEADLKAQKSDSVGR